MKVVDSYLEPLYFLKVVVTPGPHIQLPRAISQMANVVLPQGRVRQIVDSQCEDGSNS